MADSEGSLRVALADRYTIERELGRGGNAVVYLARDLRHNRKVALKVLLPELALSVRTERFFREIQIAAQLTHPHILPLLDSGQAGESLFYVMPYVQGESLRDRLNREKQLPLEDALAITRDVAEALGHAHGKGVVHRDIKPENILLSDGGAIVADFGIARALTTDGEQGVTESGVAVGTPAYMSPEQSAATGELDARSDLYSLGCVLYEMLAGHPPFTGTTAQEILARQALDPVPSMRAARAAVPEHIERAVTRALAKQPADRFASAAQFAVALREPAAGFSHRTPGPMGRRMPQLIGGAALALVLGTTIWWRWGRPAAELDPDVVVVLPFRVRGGDSSVSLMREGMVDLLHAKLSGEGGLRAREPQTVLSAWKRAVASENEDMDEGQALALAERLGAGQLLLGGIVATSGRVTLNATLLRVPGGDRQAAASVVGSPDSIMDLVDRLTASLVARRAGVGEASLSSLTTTSLPALERYLAGRAARRRGRITEAVNEVDRALQIDSSFAAAAVALARWSPTVQQQERIERGRRLAWRYRERLSARDRALLPANLAGDYPPRLLFGSEAFRIWEGATVIAPDDPEIWWAYGTQFLQLGTAIGLQLPIERAGNAFREALELDSGFALPLQGLVNVSLLAGDTAEARRYLERYVALDYASDVTDALRWLLALNTKDEQGLAVLRARFDSIPVPSLQRMVGWAQTNGTGLEDAERAAARLRRTPGTRAVQWRILLALHHLALNQGRPRAALELTEAMEDVELRPGAARVVRVLDALYWEGDTTAGAEAARRLEVVAAKTGSDDEDERLSAFEARCVVELWRLAHDDRRSAPRTLVSMYAANSQILERGTADEEQTPVARLTVAMNSFCAPALAMELAGPLGGADAARGLEQVDSLAGVGATSGGSQRMLFDRFLPLIGARWHERVGQVAEARRVLQRRPLWDYRSGALTFLSTTLVEEGRLAALMGDRAGAIQAYRHYLALRSNPEPSLRPEVERVRTELVRLLAESAMKPDLPQAKS